MKKGIILTVAAIVMLGALGGLWWYLTQQQSTNEPDEEPQQVVSEVPIRFFGEVKAKQYAELGFETTGIAQLVDVQVGDRVEENQQLVVLDRQLQEADIAGAFANKVSAQDNTLIAWETAKSTLAKTKAENKQTVAKARQKVIDSKAELDKSRTVFNRTSDEDGDDAATTANKELAFTTAQKTYNDSQEALTEARKTAEKENQAAEDAARQAEAAYAATTQASLTSTGVSSLAALENSARVRLARKILTAPFAGTVTKLDLEPNELALGGQPILTIQSVDRLEIEAQISETDITNISVGQQAEVTFDAFGDDRRMIATVSRIYPAGEKIDGVTRYTTYLDVEDPDQALLPGFTANIFIER